MAGMVIPTKATYEKDTVEILKSIEEILDSTQKDTKDDTKISKESVSILKKTFTATNIEIKSMLKQEMISEGIAKELQEANKQDLVTEFRHLEQTTKNNAQQAVIDRKLALGLYSEHETNKLTMDKERLELQKQAGNRDMEILRLAKGGFISKREEKYLRLKNKTTLYIQKQLVKKKWLETVGKSLLNLVKNAGSGIMSLLKFLFVMALFPGLLDTIVNIFINVATMIINVLTPFIPRIIKSMINIIVNVLPAALQKAIGLIFPAIGEMLTSWAEELKKSSPFFGWVIEQFAKLFGPKGVLTEFFKGLAGMAPVLIALALIIKAVLFLMPLFVILGKAFAAIGTFFAFIMPWITGLVALLGGPFVAIAALVIGAIIGAIALLIIFRKEIAEFFLTIGKWLGNVFSIAWDWINGLVDSVKNFQLGKFLKTVWKEFKKFGDYLWKQVKKAGSYVGNKIRSVFNGITSLFSSVFGPVFDVFKEMGIFFSDLLAPVFERLSPVLEKIGSVLKSIWDNVIFYIVKAMKAVKKTISELSAWFTGSSQFGVIGWAKKNETEKRRFASISASAEGNVDMSIMKDWVEAGVDERRRLENEGKGNELVRESIEAAKRLQDISKNNERNFEKLLNATIANGERTRNASKVFRNIKSFTKRLKNKDR